MLIVLVLIALVVVLVLWRAVAIVRRREPSRPIDSGHPRLTDVDPHSSSDRPT